LEDKNKQDIKTVIGIKMAKYTTEKTLSLSLKAEDGEVKDTPRLNMSSLANFWNLHLIILKNTLKAYSCG
jgi:hypothetical protein